MPVFARARILIHDYCLIPRPVATLEYTGPNPQRTYEYIRKIFTTLFGITEKEIQEREFRWDRVAGGESFHVRFETIKDLDTFTFQDITVIIDGTAHPSKEFGKEGSVKISFEGKIRTEYPQDTVWQRSLLYEMFRTMYHKLIYQGIRKKYVEECRGLLLQFGDELKQFFNLLPQT
ncbi:MAG: hypothetical protein HYT70_02730 [Candidatus Aenigmarchaeota archaeon]|nr:hypothetical protein [Candidatus Aenigmarchaeota archaeon]